MTRVRENHHLALWTVFCTVGGGVGALVLHLLGSA